MTIGPCHTLQREIIADRSSGSSYICRKLKEVFPVVPAEERPDFIKAVIESHAGMAAVINTVNALCLQEEDPGFRWPEENFMSTAELFWRENQEPRRWVTISNSYWVTSLFLASPERLRIGVGLDGAGCEGERTAGDLSSRHDTETFLLSDPGAVLRDADAFLLGCDFISGERWVNKRGSAMLMMAADWRQKPVYVIASGDKTLNGRLLPFYRFPSDFIREGDSFEILPRSGVNRFHFVSEPWDFPISQAMRRVKKELGLA